MRAWPDRHRWKWPPSPARARRCLRWRPGRPRPRGRATMSTHEQAGDAGTEREPTVLHTATAEDALDAVLRQYPDALVAAVSATGVLTELPASVRLHGQLVFEGGSGMDLIAAEDRVLVLAALDRVVTEPVA